MQGAGFNEGFTRFANARKEPSLTDGAQNLVLGCAAIRPDDRVLILHEDPSLGWFDREAPTAVAVAARAAGAHVTMIEVSGPGTPLPAAVHRALANADAEIWFARIGDQDRFCARDPVRTKVVSYARTQAALASDFGTRPHAQMFALKQQIEDRLSAAKVLRVTCPLGTDLSGSAALADAEDVTIHRFPMSMPRPVPAAGFSGRVVLKGFLTPTGSRTYDPACLRLKGVVTVHVAQGRITGFQGADEAIADLRSHYRRVADLFGIDPNVVHSWHAGIHSGCRFDGAPGENPDLWSNTVFGNPDWLHFHTCGDYAPGEICWMVCHPTVMADDESVWQDGRLCL